MDLDRAYLYFFNDKDEPQLHAASGITRNFKPKPSFYAMAQMYRALGEYRFARAVAHEEKGVYCFEYDHATKAGERVYVAWRAGDDPRAERRRLAVAGVYRAERMRMKAAADPAAAAAAPSAVDAFRATADGVEVEVGGNPLYLWGH